MWARYENTGAMADLDRAVSLFQQAVAATPDGHPDRARRLSNLGGALRDRYEHTRDPADLDRAIDLLEQAMVVTPSDQPDRSPELDQASGSPFRPDSIGSVSQRTWSGLSASFREASGSVGAAPGWRARAAAAWGSAGGSGRGLVGGGGGVRSRSAVARPDGAAGVGAGRSGTPTGTAAGVGPRAAAACLQAADATPDPDEAPRYGGGRWSCSSKGGVCSSRRRWTPAPM